MKRADMQKFLQEHPNALNRVQQAIAVQKEMQEIKAKAIADGTFMKAPNGKPTKLNERQWLQVRTKNFINWFGDWINDPANASKVVDENGEPLVVWHGSKTSNGITIFNDGPTYFSDRFTASSYTPSSFVAKDETDYMYPCFLNIKSPKLINGNGSYWNNVNGMSTDDIIKSIDRNEDGIIIKDIKDYSEFAQGNPDLSIDLLEEAPLHTDYVTTNPNQIKSATDNNGMFSTENDDIQAMVIGKKGAESLDAAEEATTRMDNLSVANDMEKAGKDALTIKRATGWERGADGKWRYEVEDLQLVDKIVKQLSDETILDYHYHDYQEDTYYTKERFNQMENEGFEFDPWVKKEYIPNTFKVTDIIKQNKAFNSLVKAYPKLKNLTIIIDSYKGPGISDYQNRGSYDKSTNTLTINLATPKEFISVLNHELQHVLQDLEGFSYGANLGQFENHPEIVKQKNIVDNAYKKLIKAQKDREAGILSIDDYFHFYDALRKEDEKLHNLPYELYRRVAGEVEARTVEKRLGLSMEERRNSLFTDDMYKDVAKKDLVFLQDELENSIAESRKGISRHNKNDVSAFHLSRDYYEVSNEIFKIPSEKKYKREIQSFIQTLPETTDRSKGIWYLSKDGKRTFRINTSVENFEDNKKETGYGFEVADWYNIENLIQNNTKNL
jgi:hypothetical protein